MGHIIVIGALVGLLVLFQFISYFGNRRRIKQLDNLFENVSDIRLLDYYIPVDEMKDIDYKEVMKNETTYRDKNYAKQVEILEEDGSTSIVPGKKVKKEQVKLISVTSKNYSSTFMDIMTAINTYLLRNRNAAGDFALMKDIVERNCLKLEEEIEDELPIPLYLGLMGTMLGIIVGIGYIAFSGGGFAAFIQNPTNSIGDLMSGIAVAMIASFIGILLTTRGTVKSKNAKVGFENEKNSFYSWLQTNLLPVVSQTVGSTLATLQRNLTSFNDSFKDNVTGMEKTLGATIKSLSEQKELIRLINELDVKKIATANIAVLRELQQNMEQFHKFSAYIESVNTCMAGVTETTKTIGEVMERTKGMEDMVVYFKKENEAIEQRKSAINAAIGKVDDALRRSFEDVSTHASNSTTAFKEVLTSQLTASREIVEAINTEIKGSMVTFQESLKTQTESLQKAVDTQAKTMDGVQKELSQMASVKEAMLQQSKKIEELNGAIRQFQKMAAAVSAVKGAEGQIVSLDRDEKDGARGGTSVVIIVILSLLFVMALLMFLKAYFGLDLMRL